MPKPPTSGLVPSNIDTASHLLYCYPITQFQGLLRGVLHARPKVRSSGRGPVAFPSLLLRLITGICGSVRRSHRPTGARLA